MPDVAISSLDIRLRKLFANARKAEQQGDDSYVIEVCNEILDAHPGCVAARRIRHAVRLRRTPGGGKMLGRAAVALERAKSLFGQRHGGTAEDRLRRADEMLANRPTSKAGLRTLASAATELDYPETALFAREVLAEIHGRSPATGLELARALLDRNRHAEAVQVAENLMQRFPRDADVRELMRQVSIAQTMATGKWESGGSFRDNLRQ